MADGKGTDKTEYQALTLDVDYYQSLLDDVDISEDEKREFIETLWNIMVQFVDMGFGIEATQLALDSKTTSKNEFNLMTQTKEETQIC